MKRFAMKMRTDIPPQNSLFFVRRAFAQPRHVLIDVQLKRPVKGVLRRLAKTEGHLREPSACLRAPYQSTAPGQQIQGRVGETIEVPGGKIVVVHRAGDFTVVPWSRRLEQRRDREVVGTMGMHQLMIGRARSLPGRQR